MSGETPARNAVVSGVAGASGGFLSGVLGGGGGAIMIPFMTGPLRMGQHIAHGTSLAIIVVTAAVAATAYTIAEPISARLALALTVGAVTGAIIGAKGALRIPAMRLRQLFGVFLITVSMRLLLMETINPLLDVSGFGEYAIGTGIGLAGGLASGALGVGGGAIFVPAMVLILGTGQHEAQGISLWVVVAASLVGAVTHYRQGTVDMRVARWFAPFALPGAIIGVLLATSLSGRSLQVLFAVILTAIGVQMLLTATRRLRKERLAREQLAATPGAA